ncbi:MAG: hypothetical protein ACI36W_05565 [Coriobacteriales bacterium]
MDFLLNTALPVLLIVAGLVISALSLANPAMLFGEGSRLGSNLRTGRIAGLAFGIALLAVGTLDLVLG